jgi:hypothetical protein
MRGQAIARLAGITRRAAHGRGRDDVRRRGRLHEALGQAAPTPLLDLFHEAVRLQETQVVVHFLTGEADARRERGRRAGGRELGQEARAHGIEGNDGRGRILDDLDVHDLNSSIDDKSCQC